MFMKARRFLSSNTQGIKLLYCNVENVSEKIRSRKNLSEDNIFKMCFVCNIQREKRSFQKEDKKAKLSQSRQRINGTYAYLLAPHP